MRMANKRKETVDGHLMKLSHRPGRKDLSLEFLMALYRKQSGRCALSGVTMTWMVGAGHAHTNISIDRIRPKDGYTKDNVRLVCHVVNLMRRDMPDDVFREWCETLSYSMAPKMRVA